MRADARRLGLLVSSMSYAEGEAGGEVYWMEMLLSELWYENMGGMVAQSNQCDFAVFVCVCTVQRLFFAVEMRMGW